MTGTDRVGRWIERYEQAWRTAGTEALVDLFTADATYLAGPFEEPVRGLGRIEIFWEAQRDGPDEVFTMRSEVFLDAGSRGVAKIEVEYGDPVTTRYRDLWLMEFADDGRVTAFEEWPFSPPNPRAAASGSGPS